MTDRPIADYAIIGDTRTTALVARDGSIDWLCWPRHDGPALFLRLLDEARGGACELLLDGVVGTARRYLPGTNVLETTFTTARGRARLLDFMTLHPLADAPEALPAEGPDGRAPGRVVRHLVCDEGEVSGRWRVRPTPDYARAGIRARLEMDGSILFEAEGIAAAVALLRASATVPLAPVGQEDHAPACEGALHLRVGASANLVLALDGGVEEGADPAAVATALAATGRYWRAWSGRCAHDGPYREAVVRSALALKLLTHAPTGGIVAAATLGLPEAVPGERNYDYRYVWLRDASFTVTAFVNLGYLREAAEFLRFLRDADPTRGRELRLMYALDGPVPPETELDHLRGWRGVGPPRVGNDAAGQRQYDIYGELLMALHTHLEAVRYDPPVRVNDHMPEALGHLAGHILRHRDDPDHGIWELRGETRQIVHTKAMLWVGLTCAASIARAIGAVDPDTIAGWERGAAEIRAEYEARGWSEAAGSYVAAYGSDDLDAAVLRTVLFGAFDPRSPRVAATLDAIGARLGAGDLVRRYDLDDGLAGREATFTACAFWRVGCLALAGRIEEADGLFARLIARGNDLGLFAEEIDAESGEQRGNVPQGFTHMAVINHAVRLEAERRRAAAGREEDGPGARREEAGAPAGE